MGVLVGLGVGVSVGLNVGTKVGSNTSDILTGVVGVKASKNFALDNGMNIRPEARLAATYDLMDDDNNAAVTLANGQGYIVDGEKLDRFGIEAGLGLAADVSDNWELSAGYEGHYRSDYTDHTGMLNAKYKFQDLTNSLISYDLLYKEVPRK